MMKEKYIVIFVTAKDLEQANKIVNRLLHDKLVACANVVKDIESVFWWNEKIDRAQEVLIILKSQQKVFNKIIKAVKAEHSYEVPEVIALPILDGNKDYLGWIDESIG